jgi:hypothetical protein
MRILVSVGVLAWLMWPSPASADLIDFTQVSRGPSDTLVFKGVTISAADGAQVSMVAGRGLGVGSNGSVDGQLSWDFDQTVSDFSRFPPFKEFESLERRMRLSVDGRINSLTLQPYMKIDGPAPIDGVPLRFLLRGEANHPEPSKADLVFSESVDSPFAPLTIDFTRFNRELDLRPNEINDFGLRFYDVDPIVIFEPYLLSHKFPDVTFSFGFSITALDYDPSKVPEPGTLSLLLMGGGSAWWWRRRHRVP